MLTSLELFGFKSFADRTLFEFSPGITCVVGPNGSGKSNVVDAIKWILGDQSAKSLRGKEMSDVIFNGSSGRKGSGFAEAILSFDNDSGYLSIDAREVRIGRRLYRSGESEYLLNGTVVRLKDVKDVFMGSGAGTAAYSIIEQGRVDQILQANPSTRRSVFEEAAGISRYKARKIDAERKLEKVAQNLLRLTDIVDEVEAQLNATRGQASKAAKYRDVTKELKACWVGLAADDFRVSQRELRQLEGRESEFAARLESLANEIGVVERTKAALDDELTRLDDALRTEERAIATVREQIAAHESTIRHQTSREQELAGDLDRLRRDRLTFANQAAAVRNELEETTEQLILFETRVDTERVELRDRETQCTALELRVEELRVVARAAREARHANASAINQLEHQATKLTSRQETLAQAIADGQRRVEESLLARRDVETNLHSAETRAAAVETEHQHYLAATEAIRQDRQRLTAELSELDGRLGQLREQRSAAVARIHVLEDLEKRQEGIAIGVQEILRRAHDSPYPPWNEILGSVSDLLQVALEHAPLLEVALGARSQLVVVRRLAPVLEYLNRQVTPISGRVGFLELSAVGRAGSVSRDAEPSPLASARGVIARADTLAEAIPEATGLPAQLLGDTWVVGSLNDATRLAADFPQARFVTLQGELRERDGAVYAGAVPHTTALVSRRSELRDRKHEVIRLDRQLSAGAERRELLAEQIVAAAAALASREQEAGERLQAIAEVRSLVESQQRDLSRLNARHESLLSDLQTRQGELAEIETQQHATNSEQQRLRESIEQDDQRIADAESRVRAVEDELVEVREELKEQHLLLAKHNERLTGLREANRRLHDDQLQREARRDAAVQRLAAVQESLRQSRLTILRTRSEYDTAFLAVEQMSATLRDRQQQRKQLRSQWSTYARQEEELHKQRRMVQDEGHQLEIRLRELRHQLSGLDERIREEYLVSIEELAASGASAYLERLTTLGTINATTDEAHRGVNDHNADDHHGAVGSNGDAAVKAEAAGGLTLQTPTDDAGWAAIYAVQEPSFADVRPELEEEVNRLRRKLKMLGSVNTDALNELDDLESRFTHLSAQLTDLQEAKATLEEIIRRINRESRRIFLETFETIQKNFRELFRKVFGGGEGDIILEDSEDILECGIDIVARPPGKELRSISLLSGGEKTMTAVALLFAMFKSKPSPYCILDEVDAAARRSQCRPLRQRRQGVRGADSVCRHHAPQTHHDGRLGPVRSDDGASRCVEADVGAFRGGQRRRELQDASGGRLSERESTAIIRLSSSPSPTARRNTGAAQLRRASTAQSSTIPTVGRTTRSTNFQSVTEDSKRRDSLRGIHGPDAH
ncbi:MAG: chromosome segregation protein SMC [Planctomycetaceae bacterium]